MHPSSLIAEIQSICAFSELSRQFSTTRSTREAGIAVHSGVPRQVRQFSTILWCSMGPRVADSWKWRPTIQIKLSAKPGSANTSRGCSGAALKSSSSSSPFALFFASKLNRCYLSHSSIVFKKQYQSFFLSGPPPNPNPFPASAAPKSTRISFQ